MMKTITLMIAGVLTAIAASAEPNSQEQLLIYELNRARNNPVRYQTENSGVVTADLSSVTAQMPLALNTELVDSAQFRATEMVVSNYCAHQSAVTGMFPNEIARSFGYQLPVSYPDAGNNIEAIFCLSGAPALTNTVAKDSLAALIEDNGNNPPGNRIQLLAIDPFFQANREIGAGVSSVSTTITGHAAVRSRIVIQTAQVNAGDLFLTGVVYADANSNHRYDLNEGLGGVAIGNGATSVVSSAAGGWAIPVTAGVYDVMASGGAFSGIATAQVSVVSANIEIDFVSGNTVGEADFANQIVAPPAHDLAVVKLKAPKKIALSATTTSKTGKFSVSIQNRGPQAETIPNLAALGNLVTVAIESLGTNCASFAATLVPPKKSFPISVAPNKKLTLAFTATFNCPNDPMASSKTESHADYRTTAAIDLSALGESDTSSANNTCPRPPSGSDLGCGGKTSAGTLGADVLIDVVVK